MPENKLSQNNLSSLPEGGGAGAGGGEVHTHEEAHAKLWGVICAKLWGVICTNTQSFLAGIGIDWGKRVCDACVVFALVGASVAERVINL